MRACQLLRPLGLSLIAVLSASTCSSRSEAGQPSGTGARLQQIASGLSSPLYLTAPPADSSRLFVVEQTGAIRIIKDGAVLPTPFLDVSGEITSGGEQGLLGMAFDPSYA